MKFEQQSNPKEYASNFQKVVTNILLTSSWLSKKQSDVLKKFDLTLQQFNILKILRGLNGESATIKFLTEKMIDKMSNTSRLVDKLLAKELVRREECQNDRRRVDIFITEKGRNLLLQASEILDALFRDAHMSLSEEQILILSNLLEKIRQ
jgi:DNA-binding MarR family transcriptional regulator